MNKLDSLSELTIRKPLVNITGTDVDRVTARLRQQRMRWSPVKRAARLGDRVFFNYSIVYRGRVIEAHEAEPLCVVLGQGTFHGKIERRTLVGLRIGERAVAIAQLPRHLPNKELAGRRVTYQMTITDISRPVLPRLDRQFAKELGLEKGGEKTLRKEIRNIMQREVDALTKQKVREQVLSELLARYPISIDKDDLKREVERRSQGLASEQNEDAMRSQPLPQDPDDVRTLAKLSMILQDVVREYGVIPDTKRLLVTMKALALRADNPETAINKYREDFETQSRIEAELLEDQALEQALSHAQLREDPTRYDDLIASAQARDGNTEWPILPVIQLRRDNKCAFCAKSKCCTYITQAVPTPRSKLDFDHLLWQVSHENIEVFKDEDGWQLLIRTRCSHLQVDGRCGIYETRPHVCRNYSIENCEFSAPADRELHFPDYDSLLVFCNKRFRRRKQTTRK